MKKVLLAGVVLLVMLLTNPSKDEYVQWLTDKAKEKSNNSLVNAGIQLLGPHIFSAVTKEDNWLFISYYDTKIQNHEIKALGLFKHFIPLSEQS
ncbi:DUF4359 domain-containing protein [Heyndrickxia acidicola]|uniref:DUF4359 domain-containing protein n=1 Tax=Heyndrickxia acidicola TaxID=209389 RepID=A0ABU6MMX2_9BACI|nr:hypothetical protein [Heyndrickxia acidicola]MED1206044.1 hypothetical protein [Heyndrickxia acidicola]